MRAWVLARKDLQVYFRDRVAVLLGFGLPIALATVFAGAMGAIGGGDSVGRVELVVEDRDQSAASRALVDELGRSDGLRLDVLEPGSDDTARERVASGDAPAGLAIGAGFGEALAKGGDLPLVLARDPGKIVEQQIVAGNLIPAFLSTLGDSLGPRIGARMLETLDFPLVGRERAQAILDETWKRMETLVGEIDVPDDAPDGAASAKADAGDGESGAFDFASAVSDVLGIQVEDVVGGGEHAELQKRAQQSNAVAGMAVMMLLFGLVHCGGTLLQEEADGTLDRLRLAPGSASSILLGKVLFSWIVGLSQLVVLFAYGAALFDVPVLRAPLALVVHSAAVAAAVTGFGVLFAVLARSQKQLEGLSTLVVLTMSALGGSWWPLSITPDWYQFLGHFTINAWAMDGYQGLFWYQKDLPGILPQIGVLVAIAVVAVFLALRLFERRMAVR